MKLIGPVTFRRVGIFIMFLTFYIYLFIHSIYFCLIHSVLVIYIFLRNCSFYLKGAGSVAEDLYDSQCSEDIFFWDCRNLVFYSLKRSTFICFLSLPHIFPCLFLRFRSMPGSVLLLSPAATHSAAILSSVLRDHNFFFLFLYQSLSSGLYNSEFFQHFGPLLYFFFFSSTENQCFSNFKVHTFI